MSTWTRQSVIDWVNAHRGKPVRLRKKSSGLRVEGILPGVEEVDACSADYFESELAVCAPHLMVALSFHDTSVLVHVEGERDDGAGLCVSVSSSVPYAALVLEEATAATPGAARPGRPAAADKDQPEEAEETAASPYELLH